MSIKVKIRQSVLFMFQLLVNLKNLLENNYLVSLIINIKLDNNYYKILYEIGKLGTQAYDMKNSLSIFQEFMIIQLLINYKML